MKYSYKQYFNKLSCFKNIENKIIDVTGNSCFEISIKLDDTYDTFVDMTNTLSKCFLLLNKNIQEKIKKFNFDNTSFEMKMEKDEYFTYLIFYTKRSINENEIEYIKSFWKENIKEEELSMCGGTIRELL